MAFSFNSRLRPVFADKTKVPAPEEGIYLGMGVNKTNDMKLEINNKIGACFAVLNKLQVFWRKANCFKHFNF